ncbi:hypothetical protein [Petroclostridium sp. X23]|uniref:exodeoxyribonuclease X C-terminal domain-containing protein n=1 Tax=Petroclostridium sp. X23 TaxID=3045146 RepID=UPI0024ADAE49|nr:hypothetical protein [Petroclostridium sp. X23]WHH59126.1 hypothetical protein QKW49_25630 [Petroclostridium sp. X23]
MSNIVEYPQNGNLALSIIESMDINTVKNTMQKIQAFQAIVQQTLKKDHDYGEVPGTSKPTLLKPGSEKICMMMGLTPEYEIISSIEDFDKGFFNYTFKCRIYKNGSVVSEGVGSCNSKESKYRYIWVNEDKIPSGIDIEGLESKERYGNMQYKVENDEGCSLANTILKMAKKRALVDATLQVASLSEIFTQDVEDMAQFMQNEQTSNMTAESASKIKVTFGMHKGKTLGEIYKEKPDYIDWLGENARDAVLKKACAFIKKAVKEHKSSKDHKEQKDANSVNDAKEPELEVEPNDEGLPWNK